MTSLTEPLQHVVAAAHDVAQNVTAPHADADDVEARWKRIVTQRYFIHVRCAILSLLAALVVQACAHGDPTATNHPPTAPPDTIAPRLAVSASTIAGCVRTATVALVGTATDNDRIARLAYTVAGGPATDFPFDASSSSFSVTVPVPIGLDTVVISAYDRAGNVARAQVVVRRSSARLVAAITALLSPNQLVVLDAEGECRHDVTTASVSSDRPGASPTWDPPQTTLVFQRGYPPKLYVTDELATVRTFLTGSTFDAESSPQFSPDGQWVYFAAGYLSHVTGGTAESLYRARADGSGLEQISPTADISTNYDYPSPSPDGSSVVFLSNAYLTTPRILLLDIASRQLTSLNLVGNSPRWSPTANTIAYQDPTARNDGLGAIVLINPDGSGRRVVSAPGVAYTKGLAWSRDGKQILARSYTSARLEMIDVSTGAVTAFPNTGNLFDPGW